MFSPPLYKVRKVPFKYICENNFNITEDKDKENGFLINQQDNMLFRQIRLITKDNCKYNPYIVFTDCRGSDSREDEFENFIKNGFNYRDQKVIISECSASMTRGSMLSFVDESIERELKERVTMGLDIGETVLDKWYAYRGLMLSSCHCIEDWIPKIVIIPDYYKTIKNQNIKYVVDKETEFVDKNGNNRTWKQKDIVQGVKDIEINVFDGCGFHHPKITEFIKMYLQSKTSPTSILWRAPFIKGVTHELNYVDFYKDIGVDYIVDIWGEKHSVSDDAEPMIVMCESMYKGYNYFHQHGDVRDWTDYWDRFRKYQHCIGVAKWNFTRHEEQVFTRSNYQILQDLDLDYSEFALLAKDSIDWIEKIINGNELYTYCFLGLFADKHKAINHYTKSILKNPKMLKEYSVRKYLIDLLKKYKDEMKCGKLWIRSCFKFLAPDLIMLMEWAGGIKNPNGALGEDDFFTLGVDGIYNGKYLIERNPHICRSEHVVLTATTNKLLNKYCSHLDNVCIINGKTITPQRLNGADFDGDLVLVVDNEIMKNGVDANAPIVIDVDDKITTIKEKDTIENRYNTIIRGKNSLIGETSNCATTYHNKRPKSVEQKEKYESYIDLLSVINGKAIDAAKTGVIFNIPRHIAKYGKPLPYFMKYTSNYYKGLKTFSKSQSNLNRLCFELEKWDRTIRFKHTYRDFDYGIMMDKSIPINYHKLSQVEQIYIDYCKEVAQLGKDQAEIRKNEYKDFVINWNFYYQKYKKQCKDICPNEKELANYSVILCYEKYKNKNKKFIWVVAENGILQNIKQKSFMLPIRDDNGIHEYLGKKYSFKEYNGGKIIDK